MSGFKKAQRTAVKLKVLAMGPSGAGKTFGALKLAEAIAPQKVAVIDSENDRSGYYADDVSFDALSLSDHRPVAYINAIKQATDAGYEVVVIDSLTHAWQNVLDRKEQYDRDNPKSNSFTNWKMFSAEWDKLVRYILDCPVHVIATARSKQAYEQTSDGNGKKQVKKMGMAPVIREGTEYEFALVFDVLPSHKAQAIKDNTGLFDRDETQMWDLCDGSVARLLQSWLATAKPAPVKATAIADSVGEDTASDGDAPTDKQREFLSRLMRSHVFTDDERAHVEANTTSKARAKAAIEWAQKQIDKRKAAEIAAQQDAETETVDREPGEEG